MPYLSDLHAARRHPLARLRLHALLALGLVHTRGFCHHCQQPADWADAGDAYRCRHCGADPLADAPLAPLGTPPADLPTGAPTAPPVLAEAALVPQSETG